tara:strand:- start:1969 stop:2781 length:813 start_codon:yes stop_codon:yes gene_type:complete
MMKKITVNKTTFKTYQLKNLVRPDLNRIPNPARVQRIRDNFEWAICNPLVVLPIPGTSKAQVVDGGTRFKACTELFGGDQEILCCILPKGADLCDYFNKLNDNTEKVSAVDRFRSRFIAGKKPETIIYAALAAAGIAMDFANKKGYASLGTTKCAPLWLKMYQTCGGEKFQEVIDMMVEIWSRPDGDCIEPSACRADFVAGLTSYIKKTVYTVPRMTKKLLKTKASSHDISYWAKKNFPQISGWSRREIIALQLHKLIKGIPAIKKSKNE